MANIPASVQTLHISAPGWEGKEGEREGERGREREGGREGEGEKDQKVPLTHHTS